MKSLKSNKAAFLTGHDPDQFMRHERSKRPWMPHSTALLVLSPRGDQIALVLPKKAVGNGVENVRVPPQLAVDRQIAAQSTVLTTAHTLVRELLCKPPLRTALQYLGCGRGNVYRSQDTVVSYGKWIHWVGIQLRQSGRGVFRNDSSLYEISHWCSANHLLAMDTFAMSDRKYVLTLQALLAFSAKGATGQLISKAGQQLKQVA